MYKQLLQTALACTILIQTASSQIACASLTDLRCCRDKKGQSCTVEFLELNIMGTCLNPFGVSHPITTIPRDGPKFPTSQIKRSHCLAGYVLTFDEATSTVTDKPVSRIYRISLEYVSQMDVQSLQRVLPASPAMAGRDWVPAHLRSRQE